MKKVFIAVKSSGESKIFRNNPCGVNKLILSIVLSKMVISQKQPPTSAEKSEKAGTNIPSWSGVKYAESKNTIEEIRNI